MRADELSAVETIRAAYEEPVLYTGLGLDSEPIKAIPSFEEAPAFEGAGSTLRTVTFEISYSSLPGKPRKKDLIVHGANSWKVDDVTERDDIAAWVVVVQK